MSGGTGLNRLPFDFAGSAAGPLPGSIDFPMPGKTHRWFCRVSLGLSGFEGLWSEIAESRVQPLAIVVLVDERGDVGAQIGDVVVLVCVDLLPLEGLDEALAAGVVVRVGGLAHAGPHAMAAQQLHVLGRS